MYIVHTSATLYTYLGKSKVQTKALICASLVERLRNCLVDLACICSDFTLRSVNSDRLGYSAYDIPPEAGTQFLYFKTENSKFFLKW